MRKNSNIYLGIIFFILVATAVGFLYINKTMETPKEDNKVAVTLDGEVLFQGQKLEYAMSNLTKDTYGLYITDIGAGRGTAIKTLGKTKSGEAILTINNEIMRNEFTQIINNKLFLVIGNNFYCGLEIIDESYCGTYAYQFVEVDLDTFSSKIVANITSELPLTKFAYDGKSTIVVGRTDDKRIYTYVYDVSNIEDLNTELKPKFSDYIDHEGIDFMFASDGYLYLLDDNEKAYKMNITKQEQSWQGVSIKEVINVYKEAKGMNTVDDLYIEENGLYSLEKRILQNTPYVEYIRKIVYTPGNDGYTITLNPADSAYAEYANKYGESSIEDYTLVTENGNISLLMVYSFNQGKKELIYKYDINSGKFTNVTDSTMYGCGRRCLFTSKAYDENTGLYNTYYDIIDGKIYLPNSKAAKTIYDELTQQVEGVKELFVNGDKVVFDGKTILSSRLTSYTCTGSNQDKIYSHFLLYKKYSIYEDIVYEFANLCGMEQPIDYYLVNKQTGKVTTLTNAQMNFKQGNFWPKDDLNDTTIDYTRYYDLAPEHNYLFAGRHFINIEASGKKYIITMDSKETFESDEELVFYGAKGTENVYVATVKAQTYDTLYKINVETGKVEKYGKLDGNIKFDVKFAE